MLENYSFCRGKVFKTMPVAKHLDFGLHDEIEAPRCVANTRVERLNKLFESQQTVTIKEANEISINLRLIMDIAKKHGFFVNYDSKYCIESFSKKLPKKEPVKRVTYGSKTYASKTYGDTKISVLKLASMMRQELLETGKINMQTYREYRVYAIYKATAKIRDEFILETFYEPQNGRKGSQIISYYEMRGYKH